MNKKEFLEELRKRLGKVNKEEKEKTISYYEEIIQDMIDSGMDEKQAVQKQGNLDDITAAIYNEMGIKKVKPAIIIIPLLSTLLVIVAIMVIVISTKERGGRSDTVTTTESNIKVLDKSEYDQKDVSKQINEIIKLFADENYSEIKDKHASDVMKPYFEDSEMDKCRKTISDNWGKLVNIGTIYSDMVEQEGIKYIVTETNASFENASVTFTITLNENYIIEGFYVR